MRMDKSMICERNIVMRKTEMILGIAAGAAGGIIALLSAFNILPFLPEHSRGAVYWAGICLCANAVGTAGAFIVPKNNIAGAGLMAACLIMILIFGFPWQSLPAVVYVISVVMAVVPEKREKDSKGG